MKKLWPARLCRHTLLAALFAAAAQAGAQDAAQAGAQDALTPGNTLKPFASEAELLAWFEPFAVERRRWEEIRRQQEEQRRQQEAQLRQAQEAARRKWEAENPGKTWAPPPMPPMPMAAHAPAPAPAPAAAAAASESITNNQVAGVDEGGIVKAHGKHLVILRRGRLFTVNVDRHQLAPVSSVEAFGPDVSPSGAWYDEMLVSGHTVVVIGYSYARGGTELGFFHLSDEGKLSYRATYHLKSADYYSSRNYASRLVGSRLVLYAPIPIGVHHADPLARLPALRRWQPGATPADFKPIAPPTRIYRLDEPLQPGAGSVTLHSVVSCDLAQPELRCEGSGVLGSAGRVFHVSQSAVYVWAMQSGSSAGLFRLPLGGGAPSALKAQGSPLDQFSFLEQADGHLNVLVRGAGLGDNMWRAEQSGTQVSLLRVRVRDFGDGQAAAPASAYRALPPAGGSGAMQNRFVGGHLLYGAGSGWMRPQAEVRSALQVVPLDGGPVRSLPLPHGVDRIEALGSGAVAIGTDGRDLIFSSVRLAGAAPALAHSLRRPGATQGETRSHGFFYKPDGPDQGLVGLPVRGGGQGGWRQLWEEPAGMLYLRHDRLRLEEAGSLAAQPGVGRNDGCRASCTDWYGNARPIFLAGRQFALLGYELVEGKVLRQGAGQRMVELRRISFAPGSADYQP